MILGTYLKKLRFKRKSNINNNSNPKFPQIPTIHLTLPTPSHTVEESRTSAASAAANKMAFSRTTTSSSTTEYTNGYHTPTSPPPYTDHSVHAHHGHDPASSASRQEYARILYEHTMKQMERFAQDAQSRGTLSMDHYPPQLTAAAASN
ncbi:hypothetical protein TWF730_009422 [Orbilia blumenaviensis]|uniref:Uncharacterized protein n=1 Tax=Orbilia blumenaviensis TaxID=1796055 RepID=A0AAV9V1G2_9PEZI